MQNAYVKNRQIQEYNATVKLMKRWMDLKGSEGNYRQVGESKWTPSVDA